MNDLKQAGTELDGNQRYQTAREELESLLESVLEKDPKSELIAQAEALLSSQTPTPESFADMKEKLNKKLASAEESHHVGSLEEGETAPTVEALPELVIETETQTFERQERPAGDLLLGERRIVQVGVEGQTRRLIEVDAKGNRTLLKTEVVKEAVTEIVEVGTKVVKVPGDRPVTPAPATQDTKKETTKTEPKTETSVSPIQVTQVAKQEPAKAEAQVEKPEGKQLPSTSEGVDANLIALGLVGVLGGFGLLTQKKKED